MANPSPRDYFLKKQEQKIFQIDHLRSQREEVLYKDWQYACKQWDTVSTTLRDTVAKNKQMEKAIENLQKQIDAMKAESSVHSQSEARQSEHRMQTEYTTDEEELARETNWIRVRNKKPRIITKTIESPKSKMPPPIIVNGIGDYNILYTELKGITTEFQMKIINSENIKINVKDGDSYRLVSQKLKDGNYSYYSFENKQTRPIRVMAKNLHHTCKPGSILEDLASRGYKIIEVTPKLKFQTKKPLDMFILSFRNDEDINKIYEIKEIMGSRVEVVSLKKNQLVPQCKKCQAYGHTQKYCAKEPRCVKCTGKHLTAQCTKPKNEKPKCVHCGEQHPANYRGCIVAKEMQKIRDMQTTKPNSLAKRKYREKTHSENETEMMRNEKTYSQAVGNKETSQEESINMLLQQILNRLDKMDKRIINLEGRVQGAIPKTKNA